MKKQFLKYITIVNVIAALFSLLLVAILKCYLIPITLVYFSVNLDEYFIYLISGVFTIFARLGIKGIIEYYLNEYFPQTLAMNTGDPNQSFPGSSQAGSAQSGQPSQSIQPIRVTDWESHFHIGNGFEVKNGRIFVHNPLNLIEFPLDNTYASDESKELAKRIYSALEYQSNITGKRSCKMPIFDNNTQSWLMDFMRLSYPERRQYQYNNSKPVRDEILKYGLTRRYGGSDSE